MTASTLRLTALVAVGCFVSVAAHAFTYDNRTNQTPNGAAHFQDPDAALANGDSDSHFSMKFSGGSNQPMSSGLNSRFVPSSNNAFSSPFNSPNNFDNAMGDRHY